MRSGGGFVMLALQVRLCEVGGGLAQFSGGLVRFAIVGRNKGVAPVCVARGKVGFRPRGGWLGLQSWLGSLS